MPNLAAVKTTFIYGGSPIDEKTPMDEKIMLAQKGILLLTLDFFLNIVCLMLETLRGLSLSSFFTSAQVVANFTSCSPVQRFEFTEETD